MHAQACFESLAVCAALLAVYLVLVGLACTNLVRGFSRKYAKPAEEAGAYASLASYLKHSICADIC